MSKQCCRFSGKNEEFFVQECRKKTAGSNQLNSCCGNNEESECCKNCSEKIPTPCCEVIKSKKRIDYGCTEKGKNDNSSSTKCVPCQKITVVSNRMVYCDEPEEEESKKCCDGSANSNCVPCCEIVTTKKRINYKPTEEETEPKRYEKPIKKCVPCVKNSSTRDRTVYCDGQECSDNGCTPCCEVTASKKRIDYASTTFDQMNQEEGKCKKKCVPCYEITCYCERTIYCDKEENRNYSGENCDPCCEDVTCKKRISYSPNEKGGCLIRSAIRDQLITYPLQ